MTTRTKVVVVVVVAGLSEYFAIKNQRFRGKSMEDAFTVYGFHVAKRQKEPYFDLEIRQKKIAGVLMPRLAAGPAIR